LAVPGDASLVDDGKAEAAFARCQDAAVERGKGLGQGANGSLHLVLSVHILGDS
jgi:hypothetical protein